MATLESVRKEVEALCTDAGIPDELKAEFDAFWETVHRALIDLDRKIEDYLGE